MDGARLIRRASRMLVLLPLGPALYRAQTRVPTRHAGGGTFETFALVLGADPGFPTSL